MSNLEMKNFLNFLQPFLLVRYRYSIVLYITIQDYNTLTTTGRLRYVTCQFPYVVCQRHLTSAARAIHTFGSIISCFRKWGSPISDGFFLITILKNPTILTKINCSSSLSALLVTSPNL